MGYVFDPAPVASITIAGTDDRLPVCRIFCVGRNYAAHAREMGKDPDRDPPFFFTKPADAAVDDEAAVAYPPETANFHHEAQLIWSVPEIISILSQSMELRPEDVIMTGTPAGVDPLVPGDTCVVSIEGLGRIATRIGPRE
ncbi:MAG: fumarylacetoacetate hydrolase family protein [Paracoccaceae bacterium]|nr:fumarylacetoacetate hydrolase family protein [Paracoccaceae bacterium]